MLQPERVHLPMRADLLGRELLGRVLPSARELRNKTGLSADQAKRGLQDLRKRKLVDSAELGCLLPGVPRLWHTDEGLEHFGASDEQISWHRPDGLGNLIVYDLPKVEAVNAIATRYSIGGWTLSGIHWYERLPMAAVAEYCRPGGARAYLAFCWASIMDTQSRLFDRLKALPAAMQAQSVDVSGTFYPGALSIVAAEEWGAAQALTMACAVLSEWVPLNDITAWYYSDDGWQVSDGLSILIGRPRREVRPLIPSKDSLRPAPGVRKLGRRRFEGVTDRCHWAGRAGRQLFLLLTTLGQYPVGAVAHYKAFVGEGRGGNETEDRLAKLVQLGLAEMVAPNARATAGRLRAGVPVTISERGQGGHRYALTTAGRAAFCRAHGGLPADLAAWTGIRNFNADRWLYRHQDGVYEVLAQFSEMGCAVGPGWRATVTLGNGGRIEPDGVVLLETQRGREWCYLEFELSDRSYKAVKPRCDKYASEYRLDNNLLLVVCHDDRAERNFQVAGAAYPWELRMVTTTLRRLRDDGVAGDSVWSNYGEPTTLAAPGAYDHMSS